SRGRRRPMPSAPLVGSCHCGAVRLQIARRPRQLTTCNCSICRRYGAQWAYYTWKSVRVEGREALLAYRGRQRRREFMHCRACGCVVFHEHAKKTGPTTRIAVNARMFAPQDLAGVRVRRLDGAQSWKYLD
ncbi:MAG TPA: hypothetical protein VIO94_13225, partial [Phenylobacterium sp.]